MKKIVGIVLITFIFFLFFSPLALAAVPQDYQMKLGEISDVLPVSEMRSFYEKMEPVMLKYFGSPYSNITLDIKANLDGTVHNTEFVDNKQTLILAGQASDYQKNKDTDKNHALQQIYGNMLHELSHAMFYYGNQRVSFHPQWVNEGWAKLLEILTAQDLKMYNFGVNPYFNYYLNPDTIAGTLNWGSSKQNTNHALVYDVTSVAHLTLLSAASTSNSNLDFYKTFNNRVYDWVAANKKTDISLDEYKKIMKELLVNKTIDGISAYDWYFNNPDTLTQGKMGNHLGVTVDQNEIIAYVFNRTTDGRDIKETGLPNIDISLKVINFDGSNLVEKTVTSDSDGNTKISLPQNGNNTLMTIEANATVSGKSLATNSFYYKNPSNPETLSGLLIDEEGKPLPAKYIGLLKSNLNFEYKDKGVFVIYVPKETRTITLDFLGHKQEVTKGPFPRIYAMKIPANFVKEAAKLPESTLNAGKVNPKSPNFIIGITSLIFILGLVIFLQKRSK